MTGEPGRRLIDFMAFQWKADLAATDVARSSPDHGPRHWRDVARIGCALGQMTDIADMLPLVFCFAAIHDTQRWSEFHDPEHGERAAEVMRNLAPPFEFLQGEPARRLEFALINHDKGFNARYKEGGVSFMDRFVAVCWDADRLTIGRVGIEPEREYMSTETVRGDFDEWVKTAEQTRTGPDMTWQEIATVYSSV